MSEMLLGQHRFNSAEVLVYIGPPTAALLLLGAAYNEQGAFTARGLQTLRSNPLLVTLCALSSFAVNLMTCLAIRTNSSLILKMSGCFKNACIVYIGALFGDSVRPLQIVGYGLSVGTFLYSMIPSARAPPVKKVH